MRKKKKGGGAGNSARPGIERNWEATEFTFTSEQREKISRLSGIPAEAIDAWRMMEVYIGIYRLRKALRESGLRPAEVRN
jgi:hypothetical protein